MRKIIFIIFIIFSMSAYGARDRYVFTSDQQRQQFDYLTQNLRCLVCQNQSLADSNAGLAQDLRRQIAGMLNEGQDQQQILTYLTDRYGEFVLYRPPFKMATYLLWILPFVIFVASLLGLYFSQRSKA